MFPFLPWITLRAACDIDLWLALWGIDIAVEPPKEGA
jgi:hypothetical protein